MRYLFLTAIACLYFSAIHAQGYSLSGNEVKPDGRVYFDFGATELRSESEPALNSIKSYLEKASYITTFRIEGHVDGGTDKDQTLSEQRAMAVAHWLVAHGILQLALAIQSAFKPTAMCLTPALPS